MKDNVSDFNINEEIKLPKMHGHTSITLKNVKTGLVEKVESDNVFQPTALEHFLKQGTILAKNAPYGQTGTSYKELVNSTDYSPCRYLVGGLFLFQNPIVEGTEFMPAGNRMIGCGRRDYTYNGDVTEMGSFNSEDSELDLDGGSIKQVWDFTTIQANGIINCISLTSSLGAALGYGNASGEHIDTIAGYDVNSAVPLLSNQKNDFIFNNIGYLFDLSDENTFRVRKYKTGATQLSIFNSKLIDTITFDLSTIGKGNMSFSYSSERPDLLGYSLRYIGNGIFRFASTNDNGLTITDGGSWYYYEYNMANDTLVLKSFTNNTGETICAYKTGYAFLRGNKILVYSYTTSYKVFLIDLTNNTVIKSFNRAIDEGDNNSYLDNIYNFGNIGNDENLITMVTYNSNNWRIYDVISDTLYFTNDVMKNTSYNYMIRRQWDENFYGYYGASSNNNSVIKFFKEPRYLATINNLSSPIEKTNAHTMKVTYTLEEV